MLGVKFIDKMFDNAGNKIVYLNKLVLFIYFILDCIVTGISMLVLIGVTCGLSLLICPIIGGLSFLAIYIVVLNSSLLANIANDTHKMMPMIADTANKYLAENKGE